MIPYQHGYEIIDTENNLGDIGDLTSDLRSMARSIGAMGDSITLLTDFANKKLEELMEFVPPRDVLVPVGIITSALLVGFLGTGIAVNIKQLKKK